MAGAGVRALIPGPIRHPRADQRSKADSAVRDFIAQQIHDHELSSMEVMAMLAAITSSYALAIRRQHDAEGSR